MKAVPFVVFHTISFPHQGNIVTVDQLDLCTSYLRSNIELTIPLIKHYSTKPKIIGVGLFKDSSLVGIFPSSPFDPPLIVPINMIWTSTSPSSIPWDVQPHQDSSLSSPMQLSTLSSSLGECISTRIHVSKNKKKQCRCRKHSHKGNSVASTHHARVTPLTFGHHVEKNHLVNSDHTRIMPHL